MQTAGSEHAEQAEKMMQEQVTTKNFSIDF